MHQYEKILLSELKEKQRGSIKQLSLATKLKEDSVRRAAYWLQEKGFVKIAEGVVKKHILTEEGKKFLSTGFPEQRILNKDGEEISSLSEEEKKIGIPWAKKNGWIEIEKGKIKITEEGKRMKEKEYPFLFFQNKVLLFFV